MNKKSLISLAAVVTLGFSLFGGTVGTVHAASDSNKISIVGSTALQPLAETAAHSYMSKNSGVNIDVQGGGSGTGLSRFNLVPFQLVTLISSLNSKAESMPRSCRITRSPLSGWHQLSTRA